MKDRQMNFTAEYKKREKFFPSSTATNFYKLFQSIPFTGKGNCQVSNIKKTNT